MKPSKFLICENPLTNDERVFIIHTGTPVMLAEVFHFDIDQEEEWMKCKRSYNVGASVDYPGELISIGAVWMEEYSDVNKLAKLMSRMGDWYHAYLKWEDSQ
ncbi:MAG TPA: hypothetical protein PL089_15430 [Ignavibacteria bacterium]|nr:hypothetical protein [Ignavibacteria bacterium]